jgi:hypothetical protein
MRSLAEFRLKEQVDEKWPEPVYATDGEEKSSLIAEYDEEEHESMIPTIKTKPFVDPLEDAKLIPVDYTRPVDQFISPKDIGSMYLLNPLSIMACIARSTILFSNAGVIYALVYAAKGKRAQSMLCLAFSSYISMYPFFLVVPCILLLCHSEQNSVIYSLTKWKQIAPKALINLMFFLGGMLALSYLLMGDWSFLDSTYGMMYYNFNLEYLHMTPAQISVYFGTFL